MGLLVFSRWASLWYAKHKGKIEGLSCITIIITFLFVGACIFQAVESPWEVTRKEKVSRAKMAIMKQHTGISEEVLNTFIAELNEEGFDIPLNDDTYQWTFGNAVLFCCTLITTIGFGHLAPITKLGKALAMIYSSIGIPICLYVFAWAVAQILEISEAFKISLYYRLGHRLGTFKVLVIHFCIVSTLIVTGVFLFPAYLYTLIEEAWTYLDASYFVFMSSTTIGLGDYVPGKNMKHALVNVYRVGATMYLMIAVIFAMFLLALGTDFIIMVLKYRKTGKVPILVPEEEKQPICTEDSSSYGSVTIKVPEDNNNEEKKPLLP